MADPEVKVKISGDATGAVKATEEASNSIGKMSENTKVAFKAIGLGIAAVSAAVVKGIADFKEAEAANNKLAQAMSNAGVYSADLAKKYADQASSLQFLTGFADDQITNAQAILQAQLGEVQVSEDLTKATLDLAAAKGIDLNAAAKIVGTSITGATNALKKEGIALQEGASQAERTSQAIAGLTKKYGGQAEAQTQGLGSITQLTNALGDLSELIGQTVAPYVTLLSKALTSMAMDGQNVTTFTDVLRASFFTLATASNIVISAFKTVGGVIGTVLGTAVESVSLLMEGEFKKAAQVAALGAQEVSNVIIAEKESFLVRQEQINSAEAESEQRKIERQMSLTEQSLAVQRTGNEQKKQEQLAAATEAELVAQNAALKALEIETASEEERRKLQIAAIDERLKNEEDAQERRRLILERGLLVDQEIQAQRDAAQAEIDAKQVEKEIAAQDKAAMDAEIEMANAQQKDALRLAQINKQLQDEGDFQTKQALLKERGLLLDKQNMDKREKMRQAERQLQLQGLAETFGGLASLQQSGNRKLFEIGKAAAIANAIVNVAQGVTKALATYPPPLSFAAAAAQAVAGAVQISTIRAQGMADGGIAGEAGIKGIPGKDSIPTMQMPGEITAPTRSFDEVVDGVAAQRRAEKMDTATAMVDAVKDLKNSDAVGRKTEVTIGTVIGTEAFVKDSIIPAIRDAVQLDNANLGVA